MAAYILQCVLEYLSYFIGGIIQIIFISLPLSLKNWEDDFLNSMTYISFQLIAASIIFILAPNVLEVTLVSTWTRVLLLGVVTIISMLRVIIAIPFEATHPVTLKITYFKHLDFKEFYNATRFNFLVSANYLEGDGELRYNALRERLLRLKKEKGKSNYLEDDFW